MHRANVLQLLRSPTRGVMDALRMKTAFREYARELAEKTGIKTDASYWSTNLGKKSPLIKEVRGVLDLVREFMEITAPAKPIDRKKLLTDTEEGIVNELINKMESNNEVPAAPTVEDLLGQD